MTRVDREDMDARPSGRRGARPGVWTERFVVGLLVASLAGTLNLIVVLHRRASRQDPETSSAPVVAAVEPRPETVVSPAPPRKPRSPRKPVEPPTPEPPAEDPTKKALAELEAATKQELEAAKKADGRAVELEKGRLAAVAESERHRRREMLIRDQVATLAEKSRKIEEQVGEIALERDALAKERDALKAAVAKSKGNASFAVLPFKGANGTWQRPIVLECSDGTVTLQPRGLSFSMLDLNPHIAPRASIVVQTIARELTVMEAAGSPDGAPVVPYLVFVVRPDGIRPYYEARARLEPLGISFGYELVPQDMKINFPDLADLETWDGTVPLDVPSHLKTRPDAPSSPGSGPGGPGPVGDLALNGKPGGPAGAGTAGDAWASGARAGSGGSNEYIWPTTPRPGQGRGGDPGDPLAGVRNGRMGGSPFDPNDYSGLAPGGGRAGGSGGAGGAGGMGGRGSSGVYATPGDGSSEVPPRGAGAGGFRSRGTPGRDAGGSEFGFGQLPGSGGGNPGGRGADREARGSSAGDVAGLLEPVPDGGADGLLGSANPGGRSAGGSTGRVGGGSGDAEGTGSTSKYGDMARDLFGPSGAGDDRNGPEGPAGSVDGAPNEGQAGQGGGTSGGRGSLSGLTSTLMPSPPPEGGGAGSSGSSSSSGAASASGPTMGSPGSASGASNASSSGVGFALPSSLSPSASSSAASGSGTSSSSSSSQEAKPPDEFLEGLQPPEEKPKEPLKIEAPFEVVIDCQRDGLEILPGGNRVTLKHVQAAAKGDNKGQDLLVRHLRSLERKRALVDPTIRPRPRVKFIVEPGGDEAYLAARRQLLFSGLDWPMTVQMVEGQASRFLSREVWR